MDTTKKKTGPKPRKDRDNVRTAGKLIAVRLSPAELRLLDSVKRSGEGRGTALRRLALDGYDPPGSA